LIECVLVHVELLERGQKAKLRITGLMGIAVLVSGHFHALAGFGTPIMARAERRRQAEAEPAVHQPPLSGVTPGDPGTVRLAALTLASVSLAAAAVPAWRAARRRSSHSLTRNLTSHVVIAMPDLHAVTYSSTLTKAARNHPRESTKTLFAIQDRELRIMPIARNASYSLPRKHLLPR
jgi:hypothetical protein